MFEVRRIETGEIVKVYGVRVNHKDETEFLIWETETFLGFTTSDGWAWDPADAYEPLKEG